jgi:hypothetical protein
VGLRAVGATIELIAVELRHLQRTEVREVEEGFAAGQKGSSAMPQAQPHHRRAPDRPGPTLRGNWSPGWRTSRLARADISHSSVERVILPDSSLLAYYVLRTADRLSPGCGGPGADAGQPLVQPRPRLLPARPAGPRGRGSEPRRRLPHRAGGRHAGRDEASRSGRSWRRTSGSRSRRTRWTRPLARAVPAPHRRVFDVGCGRDAGCRGRG